MRILESVCGECGARDCLFPVSGEETQWRCTECGTVFEEEGTDSV